MDTSIVVSGKRFSWGLFAQILTIIGGLLVSPDVRDLIAQYPKTLAVMGIISLVIAGITKIINNYLTIRSEMEELEDLNIK